MYRFSIPLLSYLSLKLKTSLTRKAIYCEVWVLIEYVGVQSTFSCMSAHLGNKYHIGTMNNMGSINCICPDYVLTYFVRFELNNWGKGHNFRGLIGFNYLLNLLHNFPLVKRENVPVLKYQGLQWAVGAYHLRNTYYCNQNIIALQSGTHSSLFFSVNWGENVILGIWSLRKGRSYL